MSKRQSSDKRSSNKGNKRNKSLIKNNYANINHCVNICIVIYVLKEALSICTKLLENKKGTDEYPRQIGFYKFRL